MRMIFEAVEVKGVLKVCRLRTYSLDSATNCVLALWGLGSHGEVRNDRGERVYAFAERARRSKAEEKIREFDLRGA